MFNIFDDNGDKDYKESNKDIVEDSEGDLSEVKVDESNNEDYKKSSKVIDNYKGEESSEIKVSKSDNRV